jgi:twitching motility protein PilT
MTIDRQLGQLLVDREVVASERVQELMARAEREGTSLVRLVLETGAADPQTVLRVVAGHLNLGFFDDSTPIDPAAASRLDAAAALAQTALPVRIEGGMLVVAVTDPFDAAKRTLLKKLSGLDVAPALAHRPTLEAVIAKVYGGGAGTGDNGKRGHGVGIPADPRTGEQPGRHLNEYLDVLMNHNGSDLHLTVGTAPRMRINGKLVPIEGADRLSPEELRAMIFAVLTGRQREELEDKLELDCSHPLPGRGRFRMNVFFQRGSVGAVLRAIPDHVKPPDELGLPPVVKEFVTLSRGLVLVTGPTGSGKSTTLASLIDLINRTRTVHIVTIEDPIEFLHRHEMSIVNQREVGADTLGFAEALRHALRQDPDVIQVGEMRDLQTISTALTAAETGHLVFGTLHTQDAPKSVERIIDVFPSHQQTQVRVQLAGALQGVISQQLLPTADGRSRVVATEVLVATAAVRNLIREGKVYQIYNAMQAGGKHGMQTMDQSLAALVRRNLVDRSIAVERAVDVQALLDLLSRRQP